MSTMQNTTLSRRGQLAMLANDLIFAGSIGANVTIAYRPSPDAEETVRTISNLGRVTMTANREYIIQAVDDAHPDRAASTFRLDRLEVCAYHDPATGAVISI